MKTQLRDDADWKGKLEKRFNWRKFSWEWGRVCYRTNWLGQTLEAWWEPDAEQDGVVKS